MQSIIIVFDKVVMMLNVKRPYYLPFSNYPTDVPVASPLVNRMKPIERRIRRAIKVAGEGQIPRIERLGEEFER